MSCLSSLSFIVFQSQSPFYEIKEQRLSHFCCQAEVGGTRLYMIEHLCPTYQKAQASD